MKYYDRLCRNLSRLIMAVCATLALIMLCCSALQVFSRYFLGHSFTWTEEAARYCFIWLDMMGASVLVYRGGHATVDLFSHKLPPMAKKIYQTFIYITVICVAAVFVRYGGELSKVTYSQKSSSLKIPMGIVYGIVPVCGVLICFFALNLMINLWYADKRREKEDV